MLFGMKGGGGVWVRLSVSGKSFTYHFEQRKNIKSNEIVRLLNSFLVKFMRQK